MVRVNKHRQFLKHLGLYPPPVNRKVGNNDYSITSIYFLGRLIQADEFPTYSITRPRRS